MFHLHPLHLNPRSEGGVLLTAPFRLDVAISTSQPILSASPCGHPARLEIGRMFPKAVVGQYYQSWVKRIPATACNAPVRIV